MKTFYTISVISSLLFSQQLLTAQSPGEQQHKNEKHNILSLEHQWLAAEIKLDTLFISNILDSAYMGISEYGIHNRHEEMADMISSMEQRRKNNIYIDTFEIEDEIVNLYSNAAVVTFVLNSYRKENGIPIQRRTRFYDVWIKKEGRWLAVSSQGSIIRE